jgi:HEAT repeat protein
MAGPAAKNPPARRMSVSEKIDAMLARLGNAQGQERVKAVKGLLKLMKTLPVESKERWRAATEVFMALVHEPAAPGAREIEEGLDALGYSMERRFERAAPDSEEYRPAYRLSLKKFPARGGNMLAVPRKTKPKEKLKAPKQEVATAGPPAPEKKREPGAGKIPEKKLRLGLTYGMAQEIIPGPGEGKAMMPRVGEGPIGERVDSTGRARLIPNSPEGNARAYVMLLPKATSRRGEEALGRITKEQKERDARFRLANCEGKGACRHVASPERVRANSAIVLRKGWFVFPLPIFNPVKMAVKAVEERRGAKRANLLRWDEPLPPYPDVLSEGGEGRLDSITKHLLIASLDDEGAGGGDRLVAAYRIGELKVREAVPLLAGILHEPGEHLAYEGLVNAARAALFRIGSAEAIDALKKNPGDYLLAAANGYLLQPAERLKEELEAGLADAGIPREAKMFSAFSLAVHGNKSGGEFLSRMLRDPEVPESEKLWVAVNLKGMADLRGVERIVVALGRDKRAEVREIAAFVLGGHPSGRSLKTLAMLLEDKVPRVRKRASGALAEFVEIEDYGRKEKALAEKAEEILGASAKRGNAEAKAALPVIRKRRAEVRAERKKRAKEAEKGETPKWGL